MNTVPGIIKKAFDWWGARRLEKMKALIASVPEGRALLALAQKEKLRIYFDSTLMREGTAGEMRDGVPGKRPTLLRGIALNPFLGGKFLTVTLAHELRHFWQLRQLENPKDLSRMTFENAVAFQRVMEGDAFAFQNFMVARIRAATGVKLPFDMSPDDRNPFRLPFITTPLPENADSPRMMKTLFDNFQRSSAAESYDSRVIGMFRKVAAYYTKKAESDAETAAMIAADNGLMRFQFNLASFDGIGDIRRLMRHGVDDNAPSYSDAPDNASVMDAVYGTAQGWEMRALRQRLKLEIPPPKPAALAAPQQ